MLVEALHQAGQGALGRVVLSNQRQLVLVRASSRLLVLDVLHYPSQVRNVGSWEADLPKSAATDSERQLAEQRIALASGPVDWERYRDTSVRRIFREVHRGVQVGGDRNLRRYTPKRAPVRRGRVSVHADGRGRSEAV